MYAFLWLAGTVGVFLLGHQWGLEFGKSLLLWLIASFAHQCLQLHNQEKKLDRAQEEQNRRDQEKWRNRNE